MAEVTYKKITDVDQVETLNKGATLFINDGGSMKQMGASVITETITGLEEQVTALSDEMVKSVNGVKPDETGNVVVEAGSDVPIDATLTKEGQAADAKTVGDALKNTIKGVPIPSVNMFDKSAVLRGHFVVPATGVIQARDGFAASDFMQAKPNTVYVATNTFATGCAYDSEKQRVANLTPGALFTTPENTAYIRIAVTDTDTMINNYMLVEGNTLPDHYVPYEDDGTRVLTIEAFTDDLIDAIKKKMDIEDAESILVNLRLHLENPFVRTQIKLAGDSITAGVSGTGYSNTGEHMYGTRYANVLTATCWSNMLYHYIDKRFNRDFVVAPDNKNVKWRNGIAFANRGYTLGATWRYATLANASANANTAAFAFYGDHVGVYYCKSPETGIVDVYVDGVKKATLDTYGTETSYRNLLKIDGLESGNHTMRIAETATKNAASSGNVVRIEGFLVKKEAVVKPWGISGASNHHAWEERADLFSEDDDFVLLQFGTNDRHVSMTEEWTTKMLVDTATYIRDTCGAEPILMASCPSNVQFESDDVPEEGVTRYYHMWDVKLAVQKAAETIGAPFIDNYDAFWQYCETHDVELDALLADGLHPNDLGYEVMFKNIMRSLGLPLVPAEYDGIVADY